MEDSTIFVEASAEPMEKFIDLTRNEKTISSFLKTRAADKENKSKSYTNRADLIDPSHKIQHVMT